MRRGQSRYRLQFDDEPIANQYIGAKLADGLTMEVDLDGGLPDRVQSCFAQCQHQRTLVYALEKVRTQFVVHRVVGANHPLA